MKILLYHDLDNSIREFPGSTAFHVTMISILPVPTHCCILPLRSANGLGSGRKLVKADFSCSVSIRPKSTELAIDGNGLRIFLATCICTTLAAAYRLLVVIMNEMKWIRMAPQGDSAEHV